jgi:PKD repeat protein
MKKILFLHILFTILTSVVSATTYYSKSSGALTAVGTWGTNTDGTGTAPANFTAVNQIFNIRNVAAVTLTAAWTVSGAGSGVTVGDGTTACNFTIPTTAADKLTGSILNVYANATLTLNNATLPTLTSCVFDAASTCVYSNAAATTIAIPSGSNYGNLTVSGTGATYTMGGSLTIAGTLLVSTTNTLSLNNTATTFTFTVLDYSQSAGTLDGGSVNTSDANAFTSYLNITGTYSKTAGTITNSSPAGYNCFLFSGGGAETFSTAGTDKYMFMHISNATTLTLNSAMTVNGTGGTAHTTFTVDAGATVIAGTNLITLSSTTPTALINGQIQTAAPTGFSGGAATCITSTNAPTITLGAASTIEYNAAVTQTVTALAGYANLTITNNSTKTLAGSCTVTAAYNQVNGVVNLNGATLTLNGTVTFPTSAAAGTITGSATSNLNIAATAVTNDLCFTTGSQALGSFTVNCSGQTLTMGTPVTLSGALVHTKGILNLNGQTLALNGAITFPTSVANGSFTGSSTSALSIGGSGTITNDLFMTQTSAATKSMDNIILNRTGQTLTLGNALDLIGTLTPTLGTFASAGFLTLIASSPTVTAWIGTIGGSVTGNVTVQTYAAGGNTGWALLGPAGITGNTFSSWNPSFAITCASCPDGSAPGGVTFTSIDTYSEIVGGVFNNPLRYVGIANITSALTIGQGYWVYLGNGQATTTDIIMDVTGPVNQGNFTYNLTLTGAANSDHGWNLIANPYPAPINWTSLRNANASVSNAIYVYNTDLNAYASFVNGISSPAVGSGGIGNLIPAGQGFYVQVTAATTLVAQETYKGASTQQLLRMEHPDQVENTSQAPIELFRLQASGLAMQNETVIYFDPNGSLYYNNQYDAVSLGVDPGFLGIVSSIQDTDYTIKGLPLLNQNYSIPIKTTTGTTGTYQIAAADLQNLPEGACMIFHDKYTGIDWDLRTGPYSCTLNDTETVARFVLNITINLNLSVSSGFKNPTCSSSGDGYLAAAGGGSGPWNYYWKDSANNIIQTSLNNHLPDTLKNANAGNYSVDVNTVGTCNNGSITYTLQPATFPNAMYSPSSTTLTLTNDTVSVSFINNSTNSNTYTWDFGDGTEVSDTNTVHQYTSPGSYMVTLTAYNALCGDNSVYAQVITVDSAAVHITQISSLPAGQKNMQISKDAGGYYVQFAYSIPVNAVISVQNILGQKVSEDINVEKVSDNKIYIPVGADIQLLILSSVTNSGDKAFYKTIPY